MEPMLSLSHFFYLCGALTIPVGWVLWILLKNHYDSAYDRTVEASSEEILEELDREFRPLRRTTIRTQAEYLPFVFECIRENIDAGFEDPQVMLLLERIESHRPDEERSARFTVVSRRQPCDLHLRWVRDSCDRILLRIQGAPPVIRALKDHQRRIPRALA